MCEVQCVGVCVLVTLQLMCVGVFDAVSFLRYSVCVENPVMGQVCVCFNHPAKSVCVYVCVCVSISLLCV